MFKEVSTGRFNKMAYLNLSALADSIAASSGLLISDFVYTASMACCSDEEMDCFPEGIEIFSINLGLLVLVAAEEAEELDVLFKDEQLVNESTTISK